MKQLTLSIFAILAFAFASFGQLKPVQSAVIKTPTVQCDMCKNKIEKYLSRVDGIKSVKVDVKKKTTSVVYITDRINLETVKAEIANCGYDADEVSAEPDAYKRLPKCCKKPEDRGGKL